MKTQTYCCKIFYSCFLSTVFFLFLSFFQGTPLYCSSEAAAAVVDGLGLESLVKKELSVPNPLELNPQWWNYFNVEGEELKKRISSTNAYLHEVYATLPFEDQSVALPIINKIATSLNALPYARSHEAPSVPKPHPYLTSYTLEQQLELSQQSRKVKLEVENETDRNADANRRLEAAQRNLDQIIVSYFGQVPLSSKKLLIGLEIIALQANLALGELNHKGSSHYLESLEKHLNSLEEELEFSIQHTDVSHYDVNKLETNITIHEKELEKAQKELSTAESNLLGIFNDDPNDLSHHYLLEQQLLQATVNRTYAWTKLLFHTFKYNVVMHLNDLFQDKLELRRNLVSWRNQILQNHEQVEDWRRTALKEQDRIRQEYTALVAHNDRSDSKAMRVNQSQRQIILNTLSNIGLLEVEMGNTQWLIDLLENHFQVNGSFWMNGWMFISDLTFKVSHNIYSFLNFSLFKVKGIPITLLTLLKIVIICVFTFWFSGFVRKFIISQGKKSELSQSTLYSLGWLARNFILSLGLIVTLYSIGLDFSSLVIFAGAMMFGVSLGLQSLANNFFCGLRILFEKKLKVGDYIQTHSGHYGKVVEMHVQNTVVLTSDGQKVIVPNSEIVGHTLVNWTGHNFDYRRLHIPFTVSATCDKEQVRQIVIEAAKRVPCALNDSDYHEPQVWLMRFDSYFIEFKLVVWIDYNFESFTHSKEADFLWEIETALRENNVPLANTYYGYYTGHTAVTASSH